MVASSRTILRSGNRDVRRRRVGDEDAVSCRKVLISLARDDLVLELSRRFQARRVIPTLSFRLEETLACLREDSYALAVIESGGTHGEIESLLRLRADADVAVFLVGDVADELHAIIDEYAPREASADELFQRAMTLIELSRPVRLPEPLRWGPLELDLARRSATWQDKAVELTTLQFRIMEVLVLSAGAMVTPTELTRRVWGDESFEDRERIVAHIRRIRKLIESDPSRPQFLLTVRGQGFRLNDAFDSPRDRMMSLT